MMMMMINYMFLLRTNLDIHTVIRTELHHVLTHQLNYFTRLFVQTAK